jgi:tripartite-type tricarboxylate transporter receptor subunit TctC
MCGRGRRGPSCVFAVTRPVALEAAEGVGRAVALYRRGHNIARRSLARAHADLAGIQLPLVRTGSIKAYAVTSDIRLALAPDIPTFAEMGLPTLSYSQWFGLFAPRGTPAEVIGKLHVAAMVALANPAARSQLVELGLEVFPRDQQTPEALGALVKAGAEKWWPIIKESGIKAE